MSAEGEGKPNPEMAALIAAAASVDAETAPPPQGAAPDATAAPGTAVVPQDQRAEMRAQVGGLLLTAATFGAAHYPKIAEIWTHDVIADVADKVAAVAIKRGWSVGFAGKWAEEIALGFALFALVPATLAAMEPPREERPVEGERVTEPEKPAAPPPTGNDAATEADVLKRSVRVTVQK